MSIYGNGDLIFISYNSYYLVLLWNLIKGGLLVLQWMQVERKVRFYWPVFLRRSSTDLFLSPKPNKVHGIRRLRRVILVNFLLRSLTATYRLSSKKRFSLLDCQYIGKISTVFLFFNDYTGCITLRPEKSLRQGRRQSSLFGGCRKLWGAYFLWTK